MIHRLVRWDEHDDARPALGLPHADVYKDASLSLLDN